jgi:hypothetical protein
LHHEMCGTVHKCTIAPGDNTNQKTTNSF